MTEADVFSLILVCICPPFCGTKDLEITVHPHFLQDLSPAHLRNKTEVAGDREGCRSVHWGAWHAWRWQRRDCVRRTNDVPFPLLTGRRGRLCPLQSLVWPHPLFPRPLRPLACSSLLSPTSATPFLSEPSPSSQTYLPSRLKDSFLEPPPFPVLPLSSFFLNSENSSHNSPPAATHPQLPFVPHFAPTPSQRGERCPGSQPVSPVPSARGTGLGLASAGRFPPPTGPRPPRPVHLLAAHLLASPSWSH